MDSECKKNYKNEGIKDSNQKSKEIQLYKVKTSFEISTMVYMSKNLIAIILKNKFPKPSKSLLSNDTNRSKEENKTASTASSEEIIAKNGHNNSEKAKERRWDKLIREQLSSERHNKMQTLLDFFCRFEEKASPSLTHTQSRLFRDNLFRFLGKCLEDSYIYRKYSVFKLAASLLYLAWAESGLRGQFYIKILNRIVRTKFYHISNLRCKSWMKIIAKLVL